MAIGSHESALTDRYHRLGRACDQWLRPVVVVVTSVMVIRVVVAVVVVAVD